MNDLIHIALAANHRYINGLLATMVSIMRSSVARERLRFHVFSEGLLDEDQSLVLDFCKEYSVQGTEFHEPDWAPIREKFAAYKDSHAAFLRLFLCEFLDIDWVVYSDVDTLWFRDIAELWGLRNSAVSIQWCSDLPSIREGVRSDHRKWNQDYDESKYCCSGMMLMNLKRLRNSGFVLKCSDFAKKWGTPFFVDQDILNYVCRDDADILPQYWDCMNPTRDAVDGLVYHFNGIGQMFNSKLDSWRPLYYPWYRFFYDFVLKQPDRKVCSVFRRIVFWLLGTFYPCRKFIYFLTGCNLVKTDNFCRQLFFAWLWRHREKFYR